MDQGCLCLDPCTDVQRFAEALQTEMSGSSSAEASKEPEDKKEPSDKDDKDKETK